MIGIIELGSSIMSPPYLTIYCRHRSSYVVINLHWSVALKMKRVPTMRRGRGMASLLAKQKPRPGPREKEKGKQKPVPNPKERHPKLLWLTQNLRAKSKENPQPRERNEQHQRVARKSRLSMKLHQLQPGKQTHRWQSSNLFRILHSQKHPWKPTRHWQRKLMRKNRSSLQSPRPSLEELAHPHVPQTWPTLHQKREHGWARDRRRRRLNPKGEILCLKGVPMNLWDGLKWTLFAAKSFARRVRPKSVPGAIAKWDAIKGAFNELIRPHVGLPSYHEEPVGFRYVYLQVHCLLYLKSWTQNSLTTFTPFSQINK